MPLIRTYPGLKKRRKRAFQGKSKGLESAQCHQFMLQKRDLERVDSISMKVYIVTYYKVATYASSV